MVSTTTLAGIHVTLNVLQCFLYLVIAVGVFLKRKQYPIKQRTPYLVTLCNLSVAINSILRMPSSYHNAAPSCILQMWFSAFADLIALMYWFRAWILLFQTKIAENLAHIDSLVRSHTPLSPDSHGWYLNHYWMMRRRFLSIIFLIEAIILGFLILVHQSTDPHNCDPKGIPGFVAIMFVVHACISGITASRVKTGKSDAFALKDEFAALGIGALVIFVGWLIVQASNPTAQNDYNLNNVWIFLFATHGLYYSGMKPLYKAYLYERDGPIAKKQEGFDPLKAILDSPQESEVFMEFLQSEFATENLLFYHSTSNYKNLPPTQAIGELLTEAEAIYEDYLEEGARMQVNVSHAIVKDCFTKLLRWKQSFTNGTAITIGTSQSSSQGSASRGDVELQPIEGIDPDAAPAQAVGIADTDQKSATSVVKPPRKSWLSHGSSSSNGAESPKHKSTPSKSSKDPKRSSSPGKGNKRIQAERDKLWLEISHVFDTAEDEILLLMRNDSFARFQRTPAYQECLARMTAARGGNTDPKSKKGDKTHSKSGLSPKEHSQENSKSKEKNHPNDDEGSKLGRPQSIGSPSKFRSASKLGRDDDEVINGEDPEDNFIAALTHGVKTPRATGTPRDTGSPRSTSSPRNAGSPREHSSSRTHKSFGFSDSSSSNSESPDRNSKSVAGDSQPNRSLPTDSVSEAADRNSKSTAGDQQPNRTLTVITGSSVSVADPMTLSPDPASVLNIPSPSVLASPSSGGDTPSFFVPPSPKLEVVVQDPLLKDLSGQTPPTVDEEKDGEHEVEPDEFDIEDENTAVPSINLTPAADDPSLTFQTPNPLFRDM